MCFWTLGTAAVEVCDSGRMEPGPAPHAAVLEEPAPHAAIVDWVDVDKTPVQFVNQMIGTLGTPAGPSQIPDSILLLLGYAELPIFLGEPEDIRRRQREVTSVPATTLGKFVMSRERAEELLTVLQTTLKNYDEVRAARSGDR